MAVSSFFGLQTSLRGLIAQQTLLDTAGHNISNASTDGYSRQKVNLAATHALNLVPDLSERAQDFLADLGAGA